MVLKKLIGDRAFYRRVFAISVPIIIQNAITNFVNLLDNVMVGALGTEAMSGVSIVNQFVFIFNLLLFGAMSAAGIFTAQYHGKGDVEGVRNTFRLKMLMAVLVGILGAVIFLTLDDQLISTFGCSLGALHAANLFFRRPDLFDSVLTLSGIYDSYAYFGDYVDDIIYNNCPNFYLPNLPQGHHYIDMYNHRNIIICCGQGAWEDELKVSTGWLGRILNEKGVNAWVDFWGTDAAHDWDWWYKQVEYYVPYLLGEKVR